MVAGRRRVKRHIRLCFAHVDAADPLPTFKYRELWEPLSGTWVFEDNDTVRQTATAEKVDGMITELRKYAPEMSGSGCYGAGGDELAVECDRLARKHVVDPAPEILITRPRFEATLRAPHVSIEVEAKAKSDRKVVRYRWFIDHRLVAETNRPRYLWDTRGERTGHPFITVHAVDDAWNRAATQIPVQLKQLSPDG
ncbi:MAG TPA: hypothetical protein DCY79_26025 [Planctomycetaceae bacterium]|nr:hypothetical protein [Planctomycetaceae bacterium]